MPPIRRSAVLVALSIGLLGGCAQLQLPRVDPTGQRIFLPAPNATALAAPAVPGTPRPAFPAPPVRPPCSEPYAENPCGPDCPPGPTAPLAAPVGSSVAPPVVLDLTPTRLIAPVGSEVVLTAALRAANGRPAVRQPIEWILSQDSVGHFIQVSNQAGRLEQCLKKVAFGKRDAGFAVTETTVRPEIVTRGTPAPTDDFVLREGQSWLSITSQREGTSHVTVYAPEAPGWDQRRQTATIYWVDAQWTLPPPAVVRAGQVHLLTTTVTRGVGLAPAGNWIVRYEIAGGDSAVLGREGVQAGEISTDENGRASVEIRQTQAVSGTTQVRVQVIRRASDDLPKTVLGAGLTTVTWSAARLKVNVTGPDTTVEKTPISYRIDVVNEGDLPATGVTLEAVVPAGVQFLNSAPAAQPFGQRLQWNLGDLPARSNGTVVLNVRPEIESNIRLEVTATSRDGLRSGNSFDTRVVKPTVSVDVQGPTTARVGEQVQYRVQIANRGTSPLMNVTVTDTFDPGLQHLQGERSPIRRSIGRLEPGQTSQFAVTFVVVQPGRHCHTLDVASDGAKIASDQKCLTASPAAPPRMNVTKVGPAEGRVGEVGRYVIVVANTSEVPLTNVRIVEQVDPQLLLKNATDGFQAAPSTLIWTFPVLPPNQSVTVQVDCELRAVSNGARNRVIVTTAEGLSETKDVVTRIVPAVAAAPVNPPNNPPASAPAEPEVPVRIDRADGRLNVALATVRNPIRVGERTKYVVTIKNDRTLEDREVVLTFLIPAGLELDSPATGPSSARAFRDGKREIEMSPIRELRAGEELPAYEFELAGLQPGTFRIRARVRSYRSPVPVEVEREVTVLPAAR